MENKIKLNICWNNAEIYSPLEIEEPILYCTNKNKLSVLKNTYGLHNGNINDKYSNWPWYKEKYNIKWWVYQYEIVP